MDFKSGIEKEPLADVYTEVANTLRSIAQSGCRGFDLSTRSLAIVERWGNPAAEHEETLEDIRSDLGVCRRCGLAESRTHIVFGAGNPRARLVFVGEGPGYDEDREGEPFVGRAGQLLTRIIQAMHLSRADVYICNIIKCRPPGNRNPFPAEIAACSPFLDRQLASICPEYICALGTFAAQTLLKTKAPISKLRGKFYPYRGVQVLATYHPAFLLRNEERKRDVWEDIQKLMHAMANDAVQG